MAPSIVLYRMNGAASFVPHTLLNELRIPYESVLLDIREGVMCAADGSFTNAEYKKINPSGFVPALQVDGQVITELPAVITYLSELAPERHLLGSTPMEKAKVFELMVFISGTLHVQGYGALWRPQRFTDDHAEAIYNAITEKGRRTILDAYAQIEANLKNDRHAFGFTFMVVDLELYMFWRWGALKLGVDRHWFTSKHPKLTALAMHTEKMESIQKTLEEEGLCLAF